MHAPRDAGARRAPRPPAYVGLSRERSRLEQSAQDQDKKQWEVRLRIREESEGECRNGMLSMLIPDIGAPPVMPRFACLGLCPRHVCRCRSAAVVTYLLTYWLGVGRSHHVSMRFSIHASDHRSGSRKHGDDDWR